MAESPAFEWLAKRTEADTLLNRLQARGTLRITLKRCGLQASQVTSEQLAVVLRLLLPRELERRGVIDSTELCERWSSQLAEQEPKLSTSKLDTPTELLRRILQSKL